MKANYYMKEELNRFIRIAEKLIEDESNHPVVKPADYDELLSYLDLELHDEAISDEAFEKALTDLVLRTPKTQSSAFFNQLFGGRRPKAYLGELLAVLLNTSMYTYKVGGPMIGVEKQILKNISRLVGFDKLTEGTIAPGGSMTNYMSMLMARDKFDPESRFIGLQKRLIAYTSEESHYSVKKNAAFAGFGRDNVRVIASDDKGKMRTDLLEQEIQKDLEEGYLPFYINATAGTTVLGSFDDLNAIAEIRDRYQLWLHIDAAYGGAVIFSSKYKHLISGANKADSFSINAHKMLGTPITCSIILTVHPECMYDSFSNDAEYLYQDDHDEINPGKISLQCGRRNDALKFWALWKSIGTKGIEQMVDHEFDLADYTRAYIRRNSDYQLYSFDDSINICFNYKEVDPEKICTLLNTKAKLMIGHGRFKENKFIRLIMVNSNNSKAEVDHFFKTFESIAEEI